jgi:hypothetical protein
LKEQQRENIKQRKIIEKVYDRRTQEDKSNTTARNKEVLKLAGSSTKSKKKKTSKKKQTVEDDDQNMQLEESVDVLNESDDESVDVLNESNDEIDIELLDQLDDDDLEKCNILKHKTNKDHVVKVEVKWESGKRDWQYLYDMWADYPGEVEEYKKKNPGKCRAKIWSVPNMTNVWYFVRILEMHGGNEKVEDAKFIVLANNGYKFEGEGCVSYDNLQEDAPELLQAFLDSVAVSPEADEASIA